MQEELEKGPRNGGGLDLVDLGDDSPSAPSTPAVQKAPVLPQSQAGQHGQSGFAVAAAFVRQPPTLLMTFSNHSAQSLSGFAIQVNKRLGRLLRWRQGLCTEESLGFRAPRRLAVPGPIARRLGGGGGAHGGQPAAERRGARGAADVAGESTRAVSG